MNQIDMIAEMEASAKALGVPMYEICERAGIAPSTYYRWKQGADARLSKLNALADEIAKAGKQTA